MALAVQEDKWRNRKKEGEEEGTMDGTDGGREIAGGEKKREGKEDKKR